MFVLRSLCLLATTAASLNVGKRAPAKPPIPGTPQIIANGNFNNGTYGWQSSARGSVQNGQYCIDVPEHTPAGNASYLSTTYKFLETKNDVYILNFTASSSSPHSIRVQTPDPPLDPNIDRHVALSATPQFFSLTFSPANQAPNASLEFDLGGNAAATTICLSGISMKRIDRSGYRQQVGPAIKINQLGYLVDGPKRATYVSNSTQSFGWSLINAAGDACASGTTVARAMDAASNQQVQIIDFTNFRSPGRGYMLKVGQDISYNFSIESNIYRGLYQDSLRFFYQQRSGIAIDGSLVGEQYARAAGHVQVPPNRGDVKVPCQTTPDSLTAYLEPWTCNYTLDVTQGWYDAGDQGKYVVNGGISAAQLMMAYERSSKSPLFADGSLLIPENNNGLPDILDEARWELDFMLKMQVPANSAPQLFNGSMIDMSGLVHHKMHDNQWTPLPTDPSQDPKKRELHRPSTAAALNLAAAGAIAARIYKPFDQAFATRCLNAATTAYAAAKRHPAIYGPGTDWDLGGGAYSDNDVSDEFYWAAAELYITTGRAQYAADLASNAYSSANVTTAFSVPSGFSWGSVAALGRLDLATVSSQVVNHSAISHSVTAAADLYLDLQRNSSNGYGVLLESFPWGSNSNHLNNIQVSPATCLSPEATLTKLFSHCRSSPQPTT